MRFVPIFALVCGAVISQSTAQPLRFEVASVKPDGPIFRPGPGNITGGPGTDSPTRINYNFATLKFLVMQAYSVLDLQVDGPDWIESERYSITANVPPGTTKQQLPAMLQNLLEERFKLKLHHETKTLPVYELTIGKGGSKLRVSPDDAKRIPAGEIKFVDGMAQFPPGSIGLAIGVGGIVAAHQPISELARLLTGQLRTVPSDQKPVIDKTGLTGYYDFTLKFTPPVILQAATSANVAADPSRGPDVYTAVQQDLGLKLEDKKAPLDILVIDRAEKVPEAN
jgi:uncharacterized protein (TIGR03435 family)